MIKKTLHFGQEGFERWCKHFQCKAGAKQFKAEDLDLEALLCSLRIAGYCVDDESWATVGRQQNNNYCNSKNKHINIQISNLKKSCILKVVRRLEHKFGVDSGESSAASSAAPAVAIQAVVEVQAATTAATDGPGADDDATSAVVAIVPVGVGRPDPGAALLAKSKDELISMVRGLQNRNRAQGCKIKRLQANAKNQKRRKERQRCREEEEEQKNRIS